METQPALTGLLLAGGRGTRMGHDKAWLDWGGQPLAGHVAQVLAGICVEVLVASGDGRRLGRLGLPQVADAVVGAGPLGGLVAGLERAAHQLVAVVAVDLPDANAALLRLLADRWAGEPAVVPRAEGRLQPLHAIWAKAAAGALRARLSAGQCSLQAATRALGARVVEPREWASADPSGGFARNLNRPEDIDSYPADPDRR